MSNRSEIILVLVLCAIVASPIPGFARDALSDSADVQIPTGRSEAENSIAVSPLDSRVLLVSNIAVNAGFGVTSWISLDAGKTWLTSDSLLLSPSFADPAVAIGRNGGTYGRFFVNHLDGNVDFELGIHYKTSTGGTSWTHQEIDDGKGSGDGTDKNHMAVNNNTSGSFQGNVLVAWHDHVPAPYSGVYASISDDDGAEWSERYTISTQLTGYEQRNVNVQWGRPDSSKVFACWNRGQSTQLLNRIFFASSNNSGENWLPTNGAEILTMSGFATLSGKTSAASWALGGYPTMAIDMNNGNIYVAYATKPGSHADVNLIKSTNNGASWSSPAAVHASNAKDQWQQWIAWDDCTGAIAVAYFDSRDFANNDSVHTYLSVSYDGASTWTDFRVSDAGWDGDDNFAGHYIGLAAKDGIAFPLWSDDRTTNGVFKPYVSPIYLWGVTQASVSHSIVSAPGLELTVTAGWSTSLPALGTDYVILKSPTNVVYTGTASASSPGTSHQVVKVCECEPGDWTYIVKSTRPGFTSRGSNLKTFRITACVD